MKDETAPVRSLDARYYTDPQVFAAEKAGLLARTWQFACHASQLESPGDYVAFELGAGISVFDVMAGNHAVIGILAALRHRDATGEGQEVEVNLLSSAMSGLVNHSSAFVAGGVVPYRMGNAHPSVFPYEPLPTADKDLIVAAANDRQFRRLCEVLGRPELADDERFARNRDRTANREELRPHLVEALGAKGAEEWFELLVAAGVPCGPINTIDGGFAMAERFGLDPIVEVGEGDRALPMARHPITFSASPAGYRLPPPELDEHGAELRRWLSDG